MTFQSAERRRQIASLVAIRGRITVSELTEKFGVTAETIRRDLAQLDHEGSLFRIHGGAVTVQNFRAEPSTFEARSKASLDAKKAIAHAAVQLLPPPGCSLFFDGGTTTALMADVLAARSPARTPAEATGSVYKVTTNSLPVALTLANCLDFDVQLLGGTVRPQSQAVVGEVATRTLGVLHADVAFVGTNALTLDQGLSTSDPQEGAVKRALVTNARRVIALCDSTKFGLTYLVNFASIEELSALVTDAAAPAPYVEALQDSGVAVHYPTSADSS